MGSILAISFFLWGVFMIYPQEASFLKKNGLIKKESMRFFYFRFELRQIQKTLTDQTLINKLQKKMLYKKIGTFFGLISILIYAYLLLIR